MSGQRHEEQQSEQRSHWCEKEAIITEIGLRLQQGDERFLNVEKNIQSIKSWIGINGKPMADDNCDTLLGRLRRIEKRINTYFLCAVVAGVVVYVLSPFVSFGTKKEKGGTVINEEVIQVIVDRTVQAVTMGKKVMP